MTTHQIDGITVFLEKTDLDKEESRWLFEHLWKNNVGLCDTCQSEEGQCTNDICIRARITNKLFLSTGGWVPDYKTWLSTAAGRNKL